MSVSIPPPKFDDNGRECVRVAESNVPAAPSFPAAGPGERDVTIILRLGDKFFNGMVDAMRWILGLESAAASVEKGGVVHWKEKNAAPSCQALKVVTRSDAHARVRIVQQGQHFGAVLDFHHPQYGWSPGHILRDGIIYQSPEVAEAEARHAVSWIQHWQEEPGRVSPTERL